MENTALSHITAYKRILRYLKERSFVFKRFCANTSKIYGDSDYAADANSLKSTSGMITKCGPYTIAWRSQFQRSVTLSTTEAEYAAIYHQRP